VSSAARDPAVKNPRPGTRARAKRQQIEDMARGSVVVFGDELVATLTSGDVDRWRKVDSEWFELVSTERR